MALNTSSLPLFGLGQTYVADSDSSLDFADTKLGNLFTVGGKVYRLVKAGAEIASPANKILVTAVSSGVPTWVVSTTTTANNHLAAGVIPADYTATIADGAYFWIQVSGPAKVIAAAAIAAGGLVGTSTTAAKADDANVTAGVGACGVALEAATNADDVIDVMLKGII